MRISDRYIGKQVLLGTLYAVFVLSVVLVLGNLFKEIQRLLVDMKAPLGLVLSFVINVLPLSLMYTVPWGFLSAVLLVFSRLSSNQEITSFRVAGISLVRLSMPVFVIAALLSLLSLWLNINVVPQSKATYKQLIYNHAVNDPGSLLKAGVVKLDFKNGDDNIQKLLIEGKSGDWLEGFHFYIMPKSKPDAPPTTYIHAARAAFSIDKEKSQLILKLQGSYGESRNAETGEISSGYATEAEPVVLQLKDLKDRKTRPSTMSNEEIREMIAGDPSLKAKEKIEMRTEITKRYSFSMACFAFAFIAVPLGMQSRRRDNSYGLILSLLIGTGYFLFTVLASEFKTDSGATMMLWAPNAGCVLLGLVLFRRARFK